MEHLIELNGPGAHLRREGTRIELHAPYLFGDRSLSVPIEHLAVHDPARAIAPDHPPAPELVARTRVALVPASAFRPFGQHSNLALLFRAPEELPRLRPTAVLAWPLVGPQRPLGRRVNGLFITAVNPVAAGDQLAAWGATRLGDPSGWIERYWTTS